MIQRLLYLRFVGLEEKPRGAVAVPASWLSLRGRRKRRLELLPDRMLANGAPPTRPTFISLVRTSAQRHARREGLALKRTAYRCRRSDGSLPSPGVHGDACFYRQSTRAPGAAERVDPVANATSALTDTLRFAPEKEQSARRVNVVRVGGGVRSPSLVLFVVGVVLERWDLAGEQARVLGIPIDRCE